jgi:hypothetical protein
MVAMDIPHILSQNINSGRVVLLGSGATIGAKRKRERST